MDSIYTLLIDAAEFQEALANDVASALKRVYVQAMTFEGDVAGHFLADILTASPATEKKLIVDSYSKIIQSDRFIYSPRHYFRKDVIQEKNDTRILVKRLRANGVDVRFCNPLGLFLRKLTWRNHKKIIVVDDHVAYVGGINFSDHNFAWHDFMLRIDNAGVADFLAMDFLTTWNGRNIAISRTFQDLEICLYDGPSERRIPDQIKCAVENAQKSIHISSPYVTEPYYSMLRTAVNRGVSVSLMIPSSNNRGIMTPYIQFHAAASGIQLHLYRAKMSHLKAMLIDDAYLIFGSSNFDYLSVHTQQEVFAFLSDSAFIKQFKKQIMDNDLNDAVPFNASAPEFMGRIVTVFMKLLGYISVLLGK